MIKACVFVGVCVLFLLQTIITALISICISKFFGNNSGVLLFLIAFMLHGLIIAGEIWLEQKYNILDRLIR